jgi:hypothetical protein
MNKEKILSKIAPKDYHSELEHILDGKDFSIDVKNLLLSCIYKIEAGYNDYETVKKMVISKNEYIEEILSIIKEKCNQIEIKKDDIQNDEEERKSRFTVDRVAGEITIWHPNEKNILYAIYELDDRQIYVDEKYSIVRTSMSELLNKGENINRLEVLRDFNGWNWNADAKDIPNITINLIYQNLIYLLGISFIEEWIHADTIQDYLEEAREKLRQNYGNENEEKILKLINKLSLIMCIQTNEKERKFLLEEKEEVEKEYNRLDNKIALLEEISRHKKEALKQIRELDKILNDRRLLEKEYIERNEKLPEYHKIFSLAHLIEILTKQRKKIITKMEEENKILEPTYYVEEKSKIKEKLELLNCLDLTEDEIKNSVIKYSIELEKVVMDCINIKIQNIDFLEKTEKKEELIKQIYYFRYYCYLYINNNNTICEQEELQEQITNIKKALIYKAEELKFINKITKNEKDFQIFNVLFSTRIINLENIAVEINKREKLEALIYETDIFEKSIQLDINEDDLIIKRNKKIKLLV